MAFDFIDTGNNHKGLRIDLIYFLVQLGKFPVGDDGHNHRLIHMEISGLSVKQGGATVELLDDHLVDLFMLFADDFDLGLGVSGQKYLVKDNGVDQDEQNTVDDLLLVGEEHLEYQDRKVKYIEHHGHWKTEFLVQDQWRNIHTSGRGAGPDDDADGKSDHQSAGDCGEHPVVCNLAKLRDIFKYTEDDRVEETADERGQSEHLSQNDGPKKEHDGIEAKDKSGNRNIKIMFKRDSKTCRSPGDQIVWKNKDGNSKGIDGVAGQNSKNVPSFFRYTLIHTYQSFLCSDRNKYTG